MYATRLTKLSRASLAGVVLLIAACLQLYANQAREETEKGRSVFRMTKKEEIEVGDVPGHVVGVIEDKGLTFYENGEIATMSNVFTFDNTYGIGTAQGYSIYTFEDGSTQVHKWQESWTEEGLCKGTYTYVRGTGRFEGIKGSGSFSGKFFESVATGYDDFTGTYTLPKK